VTDVLYRVLLDRPAKRSELADMRRRAIDGTPLLTMAHELKASCEGSRITVHGIVPAMRTYVRPLFDPATGKLTLPRLVFLHFMKVGGTSLCDQFAGWFPEEQVRVHLFVDDVALTPAVILAQLRLIAGHLPFASLPLIPPPYQTMAVLRDPFSRTLSHYSHLKAVSPAFGHLTLEQFVFDENFQLSGNYQARQLAHDMDVTNAWRAYSPEQLVSSTGGDPLIAHPLASMFDSGPTGQSDEELLRNAAANLDRIDFVGTTEDLDDLAGRAATLFGLPAAPVGRLNVSPPLPAREIDDRIRRKIEERTAVDRELYDLAKQRASSDRAERSWKAAGP
jgi:hypothetical protein